MATRKKSGRSAKKPRPTVGKAKPAARKPAPKKSPKRIRATLSTIDIDELKEELAVARAELARIAGEENHARRDLESQVWRGRTVEERLRDELEATRVDLRTALADLEIARADHQRAEAKLLEAQRELAAARESERLAAHSTADARDRQLDLEQENARLRRELDEARGGPIKANVSN